MYRTVAALLLFLAVLTTPAVTDAHRVPQPAAPATSCWIEHKTMPDDDEKICGDPALMPAGSTPTTS